LGRLEGHPRGGQGWQRLTPNHLWGWLYFLVLYIYVVVILFFIFN